MNEELKEKIREPLNDADRVYSCEDCSKLRSKNEGGTVFTVCDDCWDKHHKKHKADSHGQPTQEQIKELGGNQCRQIIK